MTLLSSLPRKRVIITFGGVLLAIFLGALAQTIVATALPDIVADLGGFSHYTLITTAYLISSTVSFLTLNHDSLNWVDLSSPLIE